MVKLLIAHCNHESYILKIFFQISSEFGNSYLTGTAQRRLTLLETLQFFQVLGNVSRILALHKFHVLWHIEDRNTQDQQSHVWAIIYTILLSF